MMLAARGAIRASGAGLPYDAEVEYLESSGTQYIDTGFKANTTTTRLDIELMLTQSTANMGLFGSRNASGTSSSSSCNAFFLSANQTFRMDWANGGGPLFNCSQNTAYSISITRGSVTINGSTTTYANTDSVDQENNFLIFSFAEGSGVVYQNGMIGRVFGAKIYSNGVLVRDYIPVRVGTVGYLYDRVSGKLFGNAGTGDFVLGSDVVPVEYLESHGTEWIDTGVKSGPSNLEFTIDCTITNIIGTSEPYWTGSGVNSVGGLHYVLEQHGIRTGGGSVANSIPYTSGERVQIRTYYDEQNRRNVQIGDRYYYGSAYSAPTANLCLLRMVNLANQRGLFFGATVSQGGDFVRKFRPVRVGTEGAAMDVLTRRIYRNAGTGAFSYGNDLKYPIPA